MGKSFASSLVVVVTLMQVVQAQELHPDIVKVIDVVGEPSPRPSWKDSYSVGDKCYCKSRYDHGVRDMVIDTGTTLGKINVVELCKLLGKGPGHDGRPLYNDIQCGNGPPNTDFDEETCPGRVDLGEAGCGQIGPKWDLKAYEIPTPTKKLHYDIVKEIEVAGANPDVGLASSYSVGDSCYCINYNGMRDSLIKTGTAFGPMTVKQICDLMGDSPAGGPGDRPVYNDIQCGNGPSFHDNESRCPGRVDIGHEGCGQIGPTWNFDPYLPMKVLGCDVSWRMWLAKPEGTTKKLTKVLDICDFRSNSFALAVVAPCATRVILKLLEEDGKTLILYSQSRQPPFLLGGTKGDTPFDFPSLLQPGVKRPYILRATVERGEKKVTVDFKFTIRNVSGC